MRSIGHDVLRTPIAAVECKVAGSTLASREATRCIGVAIDAVLNCALMIHTSVPLVAMPSTVALDSLVNLLSTSRVSRQHRYRRKLSYWNQPPRLYSLLGRLLAAPRGGVTAAKRIVFYRSSTCAVFVGTIWATIVDDIELCGRYVVVDDRRHALRINNDRTDWTGKID